MESISKKLRIVRDLSLSSLLERRFLPISLRARRQIQFDSLNKYTQIAFRTSRSFPLRRKKDFKIFRQNLNCYSYPFQSQIALSLTLILWKIYIKRAFILHASSSWLIQMKLEHSISWLFFQGLVQNEEREDREILIDFLGQVHIPLLCYLLITRSIKRSQICLFTNMSLSFISDTKLDRYSCVHIVKVIVVDNQWMILCHRINFSSTRCKKSKDPLE